MRNTTRKPLRRRLQLTVRYYVRLWRDNPPAERAKYIALKLVWYLLLFLPFWGMVFLFNRVSQQGKVGSIHILDVEDETGPTFARVTTEALQLIERVDPRRYRRIEREVHFIDNCLMVALGSYDRSRRRCKVRFSHIPGAWTDPADDDYQWYLSYYATLLIHEATHGHFDSLGIPYTGKTRAFIERLCVAEQHRFALRLFSGDTMRADRLVPPFDAKRWDQSWQRSSWQTANADWKVARKERREREAQRKNK